MPRIRVVIPRPPEKLIRLAQSIVAKDAELGTSSPLIALDWADKADEVATALTAHQKAEEYKRLMEEAYEQRDNLLDDIGEWVRQSRDVLVGVYRQEPRKLGEFGFEVNDSASSKIVTPGA